MKEGHSMRVTVAHISLNSAGGGERVCLAIVEALRKEGHDVRLATVDKTDWKRVNRVLGKVSLPSKEFYIFKKSHLEAAGGLGNALLVASYLLELMFLRSSGNSEILISTCGEKVNSIADIIYVNGTPLRCASGFSGMPPTRVCLSRLYHEALKVIDKVGARGGAIIITNSKFTAQTLEKCTGLRTAIIHPLVSLDAFAGAPEKRDGINDVVVYSTFLPEHGLDHLQLVPRIASATTNASFLIIGPATEASKGTISRLEKTVAKMHAESNIRIQTCSSREEYVEAVRSAKVFLRTLPNEPFGLSIVEAMAAGCVPVVPRSGGPWFDILQEEEGKYGFSYQSVEEAAKKIKLLLENDELRQQVSERARKRAADFDSSIFKKGILKIAEMVYENKTRHQP
jgi:glycosyltransferase involved in cell wall biosynthesis